MNKLFSYFFDIKKSRIISANPDELFWKRSCVAIEKQTELWKEWDFIEKLRISNSMYTTIDALLLMDVG